MSFAVGAANAPNFESLGWAAFSESNKRVRAVESYPVLQPRNDSSTKDTVNVFIDSIDEDFEYAASIVEACQDQTVYALRCTKGALVGSATCGPNAAVATLTIGSTTYDFSSAVTTRTLGVDVSATVQENCKLAGTTAATCTATIGGTADGTATSTSATTTVTGADYYRFDVAITGGAEKTANPTATCGSSGSGAGNVAVKSMALWALAGVMGLAGVMSM